MRRVLQGDLAIWLRAMTIAALLASVLPMASEIGHHVQPEDIAVTSSVGSDVLGDTPALATADTQCHVGHNCMFLLLHTNDFALALSGGAPEFRLVTGYFPSAQVATPFQPPRLFSQG